LKKIGDGKVEYTVVYSI